ncbi:MAG: hypothetical protein V4534_07705 [Myxococcota bacterium]
MKAFIVLALVLSNFCFAVEVIQTSYNANTDMLEVEVQYVGGCVEHRFQMNILECVLSKTPNMGLINICDAQIMDVTRELDSCESIVRKTLRVQLTSLSGPARPDLLGFNHTNVVLVPKKS